MILLLRGHIRSSFSNYYLKNLIKEIYNEDKDLVIYISTFNIIQNSTSWRKIATINTTVTEEMIKNYFKELSFLIKKIIIIDDSKIELIGNKAGNVCKSGMPLIGWKRYWYGKYQIINYINETFENKNEVVLNLRFDVFSNSFSIDKKKILNLIRETKNNNFLKNEFTSKSFCCGIDNVYIGDIKTQYTLISNFYNNLDDIISKNKHIINQEHLVYIENNKLTADNNTADNKTADNKTADNNTADNKTVDNKNIDISFNYVDNNSNSNI